MARVHRSDLLLRTRARLDSISVDSRFWNADYKQLMARIMIGVPTAWQYGILRQNICEISVDQPILALEHFMKIRPAIPRACSSTEIVLGHRRHEYMGPFRDDLPNRQRSCVGPPFPPSDAVLRPDVREEGEGGDGNLT